MLILKTIIIYFVSYAQIKTNTIIYLKTNYLHWTKHNNIQYSLLKHDNFQYRQSVITVDEKYTTPLFLADHVRILAPLFYKYTTRHLIGQYSPTTWTNNQSECTWQIKEKWLVIGAEVPNIRKLDQWEGLVGDSFKTGPFGTADHGF